LLLSSLVLISVIAAGAVSVRPAAAQTARESVVTSPLTGTLKIVAFGDSLTSGHRLPKSEAYPAVLEQRLRESGLPYTVVNRGVNGDTTAGGVRRLAEVLAENPSILIVAFGANDGLRGVPVTQVRANLERIIETAQARSIKVLLVGMEALPLYGWRYTVEFHHVFPDLARKYGVPLVPFMLDGVLGNPDLMGQDGIHPNAAGTRMIAANIWSELQPMAERKLEVRSEKWEVRSGK
jgi:acyl-CoA thioesterase-1